MRIQGTNSPMSPQDVWTQKTLEPGQQAVETKKQRRMQLEGESDSVKRLDSLLGSLGQAAQQMNLPSEFRQLQVSSTHPDIVSASITGPAALGDFELDIETMARSAVNLSQGFPDPDKTSVGFGYMAIEGLDGKMQEITVEPGSTLNDVAKIINEGANGVQATVLRTASEGDAFKLILRSEKTGEIQNFLVDGDTSELEFDQIRPASNLKASFEGVAIERDSNQIDDLLSGLKIDVKKGSEGTTVGFKVDTDIDKTKLSIKGFAEQYNKIVQLSSGQVATDDASGGSAQGAAANGSQSAAAAAPRVGRDIVRRLQSVLNSQVSSVTGEVQTLAQVGITTNAKSGELMVDENKLDAALRADFDGVAGLFVLDEQSGKKGLAGRLSDVVRDLRNTQQGAVGSRIKTLDRQIMDQDRHIAQKTEALADKEKQLRQQFDSAEQRILKMNQQAEQMSAMTGTRVSAGGS